MSDELLARAAACPVAGPNRQLPHLALLALSALWEALRFACLGGVVFAYEYKVS